MKNDGFDFHELRSTSSVHRIPAIDENIEAIIRGGRESSLRFSVYPPPEPPPAKKEETYIQKTLPLPKIADYVPPPEQKWDEAALAAKLTPQFSAAAEYEGILQHVGRLEARLRAAPDPEEGLTNSRTILNDLHPIRAYFRALYRVIIANAPHFDKFKPEVSNALQLIESKVGRGFMRYNTFKKELNTARGYGNA